MPICHGCEQTREVRAFDDRDLCASCFAEADIYGVRAAEIEITLAQQQLVEARRKRSEAALEQAREAAQNRRQRRRLGFSLDWKRYRTAKRLREMGLTFREIGRALDVTAGRAGQIVKRADEIEQLLKPQE
jgi:hypothetical protein